MWAELMWAWQKSYRTPYSATQIHAQRKCWCKTYTLCQTTCPLLRPHLLRPHLWPVEYTRCVTRENTLQYTSTWGTHARGRAHAHARARTRSMSRGRGGAE